MNTWRLSLLSVVILFTFSAYSENSLLTMKIKKILYEYISSFKGMDASGIICEVTPQKVEPIDSCFIDAATGLPLVKAFPYEIGKSVYRGIIYIDDPMLQSIRKNFTLEQDVKDQIRYRLSLIKVIQEKKIEPYTRPLFKATLLTALCSALGFEIAFISWFAQYPQVSDFSAKAGTTLAIFAGLLYCVDAKTLESINPEKDLLDTILKAHEFAQAHEEGIAC
jgi:hypothetical protein